MTWLRHQTHKILIIFIIHRIALSIFSGVTNSLSLLMDSKS